MGLCLLAREEESAGRCQASLGCSVRVGLLVIHFVFRVLELCCGHVGQVRCKHRPRRRFLSSESILIFFRSPNCSCLVVNGNASPSLRVSMKPGFGDEHGIKLDWMKQLDTKAMSEVCAAPKHLPARCCCAWHPCKAVCTSQRYYCSETETLACPSASRAAPAPQLVAASPGVERPTRAVRRVLRRGGRRQRLAWSSERD